MPIIRELATKLAAIPYAKEEWAIEYVAPRGHMIAECFGHRPHLFFLRLPERSEILTTWGRFRKHRTAVIIGVDERPNEHVQFAVSSFLLEDLRYRLLVSAGAFIEQRIPARNYDPHIGFKMPFAAECYAKATRPLVW